MARIDTLGNFLTDVATAIRNKKGTTDTIVASNFDTEIESIETGGGSTVTKGIIINEFDENGLRVYEGEYEGSVENGYRRKGRGEVFLYKNGNLYEIDTNACDRANNYLTIINGGDIWKRILYVLICFLLVERLLSI